MHYVLARAIKTPHEACKIGEVTGQFSCSMLLRLWKLFRFLSKNGIPSAHGQLGHFPVRHPLGAFDGGLPGSSFENSSILSRPLLKSRFLSLEGEP